MKNFFAARWSLVLLRIVLGWIFLYAGGAKMFHPLDFADSIAAYRMLPVQVINLAALGLPPLEILLGLLLMSGVLTRVAALGITILLGIFTLALAQALLRGLTIDCGCFGSGELAPWKLWLALGRDLVLLGAGLWLYSQSSQMSYKTNETGRGGGAVLGE